MSNTPVTSTGQPDFEAMSISQIVDWYNTTANWEPTIDRVQSFRDKPTALRRAVGRFNDLTTRPDVNGTKNLPDRVVTPGRRRLLSSPVFEQVRQDTVARQVAARKEARGGAKEGDYPAPRPDGRQRIARDGTITVLTKENPRRGEAAKRFDLYVDGQTVAEYLALVKHKKLDRHDPIEDVAHDLRKGFIKVTPPKA